MANMNIKQALFKARVWLVKQISLILIEFLRKRAAFFLLRHIQRQLQWRPHTDAVLAIYKLESQLNPFQLDSFFTCFNANIIKPLIIRVSLKNTSDKGATVIRLAARTVMTTALVKGHPASCYHQRSFNNKQRQKGVFIVHSWLETIPWWNDLFKGEKEKWIVCKWVQSLNPWVRSLKYLTSFILFTFLVKKTNLLSVCSTCQQQGQRMMMM